MKYFKGINKLEELKRTYKKLAKKYHPDLQRDEKEREKSTKIMAEINAEYEELTKKLGKGNKQDQEEMDLFKKIIDNIIHLPLEIEICGCWIWVSGNTFPYKDKLNESGLRWAPKKKMWYWKPEGDRRRRRSEMSIEDIRRKYGSLKIKTVSEEEKSQKKKMPTVRYPVSALKKGS